MEVRRLLFNILLAMILALPLTAVESVYSLPRERSGSKAARRVVPKPEPPAVQPLVWTPPNAGLLAKLAQKASPSRTPFSGENQFDAFIHEAAMATGVSPALIKAVILAESNFQNGLVSPSGAVGLMQILPGTAQRFGAANPMDPRANILAGARFLKMLLELFDDNETLAVAAYNCGPARVQRQGGVPPIRETQDFVHQVLTAYLEYLK